MNAYWAGTCRLWRPVHFSWVTLIFACGGRARWGRFGFRWSSWCRWAGKGLCCLRVFFAFRRSTADHWASYPRDYHHYCFGYYPIHCYCSHCPNRCYYFSFPSHCYCCCFPNRCCCCHCPIRCFDCGYCYYDPNLLDCYYLNPTRTGWRFPFFFFWNLGLSS